MLELQRSRQSWVNLTTQTPLNRKPSMNWQDGSMNYAKKDAKNALHHRQRLSNFTFDLNYNKGKKEDVNHALSMHQCPDGIDRQRHLWDLAIRLSPLTHRAVFSVAPRLGMGSFLNQHLLKRLCHRSCRT